MTTDTGHLRASGWRWGLTGSTLLSLIYLAIVSFANSAAHALQQFLLYWYWMVPLVGGFGALLGLHGYTRAVLKLRGGHHPGQAGVAASGSASTLSMIACCAHHLTDVLPMLGFAGAALFLAEYQDLFLLLGVLSNLVGLVYMLGVMKRHHLYEGPGRLLRGLLRLPVERALRPVMGFSVVILMSVAGFRLL